MVTEPEMSELERLRDVVAQARKLIAEGRHDTTGPCNTCKAFTVLISSLPAAPLPEPRLTKEWLDAKIAEIEREDGHEWQAVNAMESLRDAILASPVESDE